MSNNPPTPPTDPFTGLILYVRAGFESEGAQEILARAAALGVPGHVRAQQGQGFVEFVPSPGMAPAALAPLADWRALIFARQCLPRFAHLRALPAADRLTPILARLREHAAHGVYAEVFVEASDTGEGKALAPFCRSFGNALIGALRRAGSLDANATQRLHAFFPRSDEVHLCAADPARSAPWPGGIPRLKFPHQAPSRSTLKLDEAFLTLLDADERQRWLAPGMSAVDLGAAPGGWTWQLVRRGLKVAAIDNGPMDAALLDSGLVTHLHEDGFHWRPKKPVDWLVCDMVERPRRVAALVAAWLADGLCRRAIFNLKLPMKKRWDETQTCLSLLRAALGHDADIRARQLYHDREEITVFAQRR